MSNFIRFLSVAILSICFIIPLKGFPQTKSNNGFNIQGKIDGIADGAKVYLVDIDQLKIIDSVLTKTGDFTFAGKVEKPTSFWIKCLNEYAILQVENVNIKFSSPIKDMKLKYIAEGGDEQTLQTQLNDVVRPFEKIYTPAYDSILNKLYADSVGLARLSKIFNEANNKYMAAYIAFGKEHINSYIGLDIVYMNRKAIPADSIALLFKNLSLDLRNTDVAKALLTYISEHIVKKGEKFLDFDARDIEGKPFKFSSLKGKYIYLTFGSFGCAPCRMENQYISNNYQELSKILHIVNFSLDINDKGWKDVTKNDKIIWHNISDRGGMSGKIKTLYDVQVMPTSFLIDQNGIIVEKFEGFSIENFKKIENIIHKSRILSN